MNIRKKKGRKNRRAKMPSQFSSKPQKYGTGNTLAICDQYYDFGTESEEVNTVALGNLVLNNEEFITYRSLYRYMKLEKIKIIFMANNNLAFHSQLYFQINYTSLNPDTTNLKVDDQTKQISSYLTNNRQFTFLPPNCVFTGMNSVSYNFHDYLPTQSAVNFPITLSWIKTASTSNFPATIQVYWRFRGSNLTTISSLMNKIEEIKKLTPEMAKLEKKEEENEKDN